MAAARAMALSFMSSFLVAIATTEALRRLGRPVGFLVVIERALTLIAFERLDLWTVRMDIIVYPRADARRAK